MAHRSPAVSDDRHPGQFFDKAREAYFDGAPIGFRATDVVVIARSSAARANFKRMFQQEINDPDLQHHILEYLEEVAEGLEMAVDTAETNVDLIDKAAVPVATATTVAGIGMLVTIGVALGPMTLFCGGVFALGICGSGRTFIKRDSNRRKAEAKMVRRLAASLRPRSEG